MGEILSAFAETIFKRTYAFDENETWEGCAARVAKAVANDSDQEKVFFELIRDRILIPGGRYLYSAGRGKFCNSNCYGFVVQDSREDWARLLHDITLCLSLGGGLGVNYSGLRAAGTPIKTMGGVSSGPLALMQMVNEVARHVMSGGKRRSALWAGLHWQHPDIDKFIEIKDWSHDLLAMKAKNPEASAPLDMTNISVIIDDEYINKLKRNNPKVVELHEKICAYMCRTGEPAFRNQSLILRDDPLGVTGNACQESTLADRDTCNLASIVLPRIKNILDVEYVVRQGIRFLMNGSVKASYPTPEISAVAKQNRRLGLGIMGLHEYLLMHGQRYEWTPEIEAFFKAYQFFSDDEADEYSKKLGESRPVTTRAIAPTGTISIIAETTSGIEPIYCLAYKRRYIDGYKHKYQYVVDPTANRLLKSGIGWEQLEDTYSLSRDIDRRLDLQANVQRYVDQAISNTINLAAYDSPDNNNPEKFAKIVKHYLPHLKGLTAYPDGARPGQPLVPVNIEYALHHKDVVFEEEEQKCTQGVCEL